MTYVYFISDGEYIKIGKANDVRERIKVLQTGNPRQLKLIKTIEFSDSKSAIKHESHLHNRFRLYNSHGEWFQINDELCNYIGISNVRKDQVSEIKRNSEIIAFQKYQINENAKQLNMMHSSVMEEMRQLRSAQEEHLKVLAGTLRLKEANKKQNGKAKPKNRIRHLWDYLSYGTQGWGVT